MSWNRVKKIFKRKPKHQEVPSNMRIHTKLMGRADTPKGETQMYRYEVNGVTINALDVLDAQRKYLRKK